MRVLVLNCGSSSVKLRLYDMPGGERNADAGFARSRLHGAVRGVGGDASLELRQDQLPPVRIRRAIPTHELAVEWLLKQPVSLDGGDALPVRACDVDAVGHRVVHGGDRFSEPVIVDGVVADEIDALGELAPLHNPACLAGIRAARRGLGARVPMVAVFDTAFHQTMPERARRYALPARLADRYGIRRYGFHGIAHASLLDGYLQASGKPRESSRLITLQLGNGCSMAAIQGGRSMDTSMGFTPLEGLVMGTRSGDLDPAIVTFLCETENAGPAEVERWLNEDAGLLGLSGRSNDMRELLAAVTQEQHAASKLAVEVFCYRAKKYLGAYFAALGGAEAVVFGGGIGEAAPAIRRGICEGMEWCGVVLDLEKNAAAAGLPPGGAARISADGAPVDVYVVAVDEESRIARDTVRCLRSTGPD